MGGGDGYGRDYADSWSKGYGGSQTSLSAYDSADEENEERTKVFVSFHSKDIGKVGLLRHQIENPRFGMSLRDYSLKKPVERGDWKKPVGRSIARSDVVVVYVGDKTHTRTAVKWEITQAKRLGKPIVAVKEKRDSELPSSLRRAGASVVRWRTDDIKHAVDSAAKQSKRKKNEKRKRR